MNRDYDVIVVGAGPAGLGAAIEAKKNGAERVIIIERNDEPGGILMQCIHNGFGSVLFKKDLPGPSYAGNFIEEANKLGIEMMMDTMALDIKTDTGQHRSAVPAKTKTIYATNDRDGFLEFSAKALVLAMGCRERTRAQIRLPGSRPAGVFTAGMVQRLVNIEGFMPGKKFVILGSGDIGMIMGRRLTIEGAEVLKVVELMPYLTGLRRNYVQCLQDFNIPLSLSTTIKRIDGRNRVEAVETVKVDDCMQPIAGTEETIKCDSVLLSVGLIPENELSRKAGVKLDPLTGGPVVSENMETNVPGIFAAGNVVTIYDLVDYVSQAGFIAGKSAALFALGQTHGSAPTTTAPVGTAHPRCPDFVEVKPGPDIRSIVPQKIHKNTDKNILVELRVMKEFPSKITVELRDKDVVLASRKEKYARPAEMITMNVKWQDIKDKVSGDTITVNIKEGW